MRKIIQQRNKFSEFSTEKNWPFLVFIDLAEYTILTTFWLRPLKYRLQIIRCSKTSVFVKIEELF